ncbi:MAG: hypothetical protein ACYTG1_11285, partial [Planctomycetota bacterium]
MKRASLVLSLTAAFALSPAAVGVCTGDTNGDNVVDTQDILQVLGEWGTCPGCGGDTNGDGFVDVTDLNNVLGDWGCTFTGPVGMLSGTVTNMWTGMPVEGVDVTVGTEVFVTNAVGVYSGEVLAGQYTVTFESQYFLTLETTTIVFPDVTMLLDAALEPVAPVVIEVEVTGSADPG